MTLWKITAKGNWNWGKGKELVKGMFIEMTSATTAPPLGKTSNQEAIAKAFNAKYSTNFDKSKMCSPYLICEINRIAKSLINQEQSCIKIKMQLCCAFVSN